MVMTRAQFARDLEAGINAHFGMEYDDHEEQWSKIFEKKKSSKAYEDQVLRVGLGEAVEKPEGGAIMFDTGAEGWASRVTFSTYALAFAITQEAIDDNQYGDLTEQYGPELARSLQHAKEVRCARLLNEAFNSAIVGGDKKSLCASDHPLYAGGAYSNVLATPSDLTEEALEDAITQIGGYVNDRHRPINIDVKQLIIHKNQRFRAERLLHTDGRPGTSLNDINALKKGKYIDGGFIVNKYLIDPDAWFLQTNARLGLMMWQRKGVQKGMEKDFETGNLRYKVSERFGASWTDPRCIFGSSGSPV